MSSRTEMLYDLWFCFGDLYRRICSFAGHSLIRNNYFETLTGTYGMVRYGWLSVSGWVFRPKNPPFSVATSLILPAGILIPWFWCQVRIRVHPQNVRFQNVWFQNVRNVRFTKRQVYKMSGLQNVRFTKRQSFKTSGCKTSSFRTSLLVNISKRLFSKKYIDPTYVTDFQKVCCWPGLTQHNVMAG